MTSQEFYDKYGGDVHRDMISVVESMFNTEYQRLTTCVLSQIPGTELRISTIDETEGEILWCGKDKPEEGFNVRYHLRKQDDLEWFWLLSSIASYAIKK